MKYVLIIGDGMADDPLEQLGGKTPLEVCRKPFFDSLCEKAELGLVQTIPEGFPPGSDTAIMGIFGCDPRKYFSGRAPLELAASGGVMPAGGAAYRCNMVNLGGDEHGPFAERVMISHSAGSIEGEESDELIKWLFAEPEFAALAEKAKITVHPGSSFRHLAVQSDADIDGIVLAPGEQFSYNDALGERTAERGYKAAGAYSGGQVVQEIGGGICQVSSTLYYAALLANLQIDARTCHYFPVGYLPAGLDATVSWGGPEFKFTNNRNWPIKIVASVDTAKNTVSVHIVGTDEDGSYVQMTYATWLVYGNSEYPETATGYKAATYRNVYDKNGTLLSKEIEAYSEYHYHEEDIVYPTPTPSPTPEPTPTEPVVPTDPVDPGQPTEPVEPSHDPGYYFDT